MKSLPPISKSRTCTVLRAPASVLATRSKQENCPFHLGFIGAVILVSCRFVSTNRNLLEIAKTAHKHGSHHSFAVPKSLVSMEKQTTRDGNHACEQRGS